MAAVADAEAVGGQLGQRDRLEAQAVGPRLQPGQSALDEVERAGHRAEVDALAGGAALEVGDVAAQRLLDEGPGVGAAGAGEDPPVDQAAEGGAVTGAVQVVVHGREPGVLVQVVPQLLEQEAEFGR